MSKVPLYMFFVDKERGVFNDASVTKSEKDPLAMMYPPGRFQKGKRAPRVGSLCIVILSRGGTSPHSTGK